MWPWVLIELKNLKLYTFIEPFPSKIMFHTNKNRFFSPKLVPSVKNLCKPMQIKRDIYLQNSN